MKRRLLLIYVTVFCVILAAACAKDPGKDDKTTNTPALSVTAEPTLTGADTATVTPTSQDTVSPTSIPTPTLTPTPASTPTVAPTPVNDLATMVARNRELHDAIKPKLTANPLGTGLELTEQDKIDYDHGVRRSNGVTINYTDRLTGLPTEAYNGETVVSISGLKDEEVSRKINNRIKTIIDTMADPAYFPDVRGAVSVIREKGTPKKAISSDAYDEGHGILAVEVSAGFYWETVFPDPETDEESEQQRALQRALLEEWNAQGPGYYSGSSFLSDETESCFFGIRDEILLNFDLATGEELTMSDLFPEGFDYLEYLNTQIEERSQYEFWFRHADDYSEHRNSGYVMPHMAMDGYDATQEIDGAQRLEKLTGDEQFLLSADELILYPGNGRKDIVYIPIPNMIADRGQGEDLCVNEGAFSVDCLADYEFCGSNYDGPKEIPRQIGEFRTGLDGNPEVTVRVFNGTDRYRRRYALNNRNLDDVIGVDFSDEQIVELAKQCMVEWDNYRDPKRDCNIYIDGVSVYPNGYYLVGWMIDQEEGDEDEDEDGGPGYYGYYDQVGVWIKDGKQIPEEELLDVSYEELMTEIIAGLRYNGAPIADREQAAASAKALIPYFVGFWDIVNTFDVWGWQDFLFRWKEDGEIHAGMPRVDSYYEDNIEPRPEGFDEILPAILWKNYEVARMRISWSDPFLVLRHLKIYEEIDFPKE